MCINYGYEEALYWDLLARLAFLSPDAPRLNLPPSESFYPGHAAPIVMVQDGERRVQRMVWGLVPDFWRQPFEAKKFSTHNYNSRADDWLQKPTFARPIRNQRCLIPATWFCEWGTDTGRKKLVPFTRPDHEPFVMAGVWNRWQGTANGESVDWHTFAMLTTKANDVVAPVHPKAMPVILEWDDVDTWLNGTLDAAVRLARPCPTHRLQRREPQ